MAKPLVFQGPANAYAGTDERILEFSNGGRGGALLGGLISVLEPEPGRLIVEVYRCDEGVEIRTPIGCGTVAPAQAETEKMA